LIYYDHLLLLSAKSNALFKQNNHEKASFIAREWVRRIPDDPTSHDILARLFHKRKSYKEALREFQVAQKISPHYEYQIASCFFHLNKLREAKQWAEDGLKKAEGLSSPSTTPTSTTEPSLLQVSKELKELRQLLVDISKREAS